MPLGPKGLSPREELSGTQLPFRIKPDADGWKLIAGEQVLHDGERQGMFGRRMASMGVASMPQLRSGSVISSRRPQMPLYVFLDTIPVQNSEIEERIAQHDRDEDWLVYADWLQQEGDPLGRQLMRTHSMAVGCARPNFLLVRRLNVEWRYCFWRSAVLEPSFDYRHAVEDLTLLLALISSPQARLLRSLRVNLTEICETPAQAEQLASALIHTALPRSVSHLELGPVNHGFPHQLLKRLLPRWDGQPIGQRFASPPALPSVARWRAERQ